MIKKLTWVLFGFLAIGVGLYPWIYFVVDRKFGLLSTKSDELLTNLAWNAGFYIHILLGGVALLVGWTQFSTRIRNNRLRLHKTLGKIYVFTALPSALAGFSIAWFATGGIVSKLGFAFLGLFWFSTTLIAYLAIRRLDLKRHERVMIFSYSFCFAAVTLRIWLPLLTNYFDSFIPAYPIAAWLCWVPNLIFAIIYTKKMAA